MNFSRRLFLRGTAGTAIALPWLESLDNSAWAQMGPPKRFLLGFAGCSIGGYDGDVNDTLIPTTVGANYELKQGLTHLAAVKDQVSIVSGLRIPTAVNGVVPSGGRPVVFHGYQLSPLLTGMRNSAGYGGFTTPTPEHIAGELLGATTLGTLVMRVQLSSYVNSDGPGTGQTISYRTSSGGGVQGVAPRYSPRELFNTLFQNFTPPEGTLTPAQVAEQDWLLRTRRSILDSAAKRFETVKGKVSARDRQRVDEHLSEIRDLERRVAAIPPPQVGLCQKPADPGPDPVAGQGQATGANGDITYSQNRGYSGEEERAAAMVDLLYMALVCDLTRSVQFQFTNSQSFLNLFSLTGQPADLHELSHGSHGANTGTNSTTSLAQGINWHMKHWGNLLAKLHAAKEGATSILDNSAAVFTFEGGQGLDPAEGRLVSAHSTENMLMLVAGGAGGLNRGLHLNAAGMHPANVLLTGLKAVGYPSNTLGETTGEITGLRG
ncbi:MAG: DUF1552 domain-containing protein [Myxococcaceae bacterium]|nr:DUF1552 domain-containing protein [Myxococcaceae bacterium]